MEETQPTNPSVQPNKEQNPKPEMQRGGVRKKRNNRGRRRPGGNTPAQIKKDAIIQAVSREGTGGRGKRRRGGRKGQGPPRNPTAVATDQQMDGDRKRILPPENGNDQATSQVNGSSSQGPSPNKRPRNNRSQASQQRQSTDQLDQPGGNGSSTQPTGVITSLGTQPSVTAPSGIPGSQGKKQRYRKRKPASVRAKQPNSQSSTKNVTGAEILGPPGQGTSSVAAASEGSEQKRQPRKRNRGKGKKVWVPNKKFLDKLSQESQGHPMGGAPAMPGKPSEQAVFAQKGGPVKVVSLEEALNPWINPKPAVEDKPKEVVSNETVMVSSDQTIAPVSKGADVVTTQASLPSKILPPDPKQEASLKLGPGALQDGKLTKKQEKQVFRIQQDELRQRKISALPKVKKMPRAGGKRFLSFYKLVTHRFSLEASMIVNGQRKLMRLGGNISAKNLRNFVQNTVDEKFWLDYKRPWVSEHLRIAQREMLDFLKKSLIKRSMSWMDGWMNRYRELKTNLETVWNQAAEETDLCVAILLKDFKDNLGVTLAKGFLKDFFVLAPMAPGMTKILHKVRGENSLAKIVKNGLRRERTEREFQNRLSLEQRKVSMNKAILKQMDRARDILHKGDVAKMAVTNSRQRMGNAWIPGAEPYTAQRQYDYVDSNSLQYGSNISAIPQPRIQPASQIISQPESNYYKPQRAPQNVFGATMESAKYINEMAQADTYGVSGQVQAGLPVAAFEGAQPQGNAYGGEYYEKDVSYAMDKRVQDAAEYMQASAVPTEGYPQYQSSMSQPAAMDSYRREDRVEPERRSEVGPSSNELQAYSKALLAQIYSSERYGPSLARGEREQARQVERSEGSSRSLAYSVLPESAKFDSGSREQQLLVAQMRQAGAFDGGARQQQTASSARGHSRERYSGLSSTPEQETKVVAARDTQDSERVYYDKLREYQAAIKEKMRGNEQGQTTGYSAASVATSGVGLSYDPKKFVEAVAKEQERYRTEKASKNQVGASGDHLWTGVGVEQQQLSQREATKRKPMSMYGAAYEDDVSANFGTGSMDKYMLRPKAAKTEGYFSVGGKYVVPAQTLTDAARQGERARFGTDSDEIRVVRDDYRSAEERNLSLQRGASQLMALYGKQVTTGGYGNGASSGRSDSWREQGPPRGQRSPQARGGGTGSDRRSPGERRNRNRKRGGTNKNKNAGGNSPRRLSPLLPRW